MAATSVLTEEVDNYSAKGFGYLQLRPPPIPIDVLIYTKVVWENWKGELSTPQA